MEFPYLRSPKWLYLVMATNIELPRTVCTASKYITGHLYTATACLKPFRRMEELKKGLEQIVKVKKWNSEYMCGGKTALPSQYLLLLF